MFLVDILLMPLDQLVTFCTMLTKNNLDGYLASVGMEKAFDSVDHTLIISTLRKYGLGPNFYTVDKSIVKQAGKLCHE